MATVYFKDTKDFNSEGLGILTALVEPVEVTETMDGFFELTFAYSGGDSLANYLKEGAYVKAQVNHYGKELVFRIYEAEKDKINNIIYIQAELKLLHDLRTSVLKASGFSPMTAEHMLKMVQRNSDPMIDFNVTGTPTVSNNFEYEDCNAYDLIYGENGILAKTGAEIKFTEDGVRVYDERGRYRFAEIHQSDFVNEMKVKINNENQVTRIIPFTTVMYDVAQKDGDRYTKDTVEKKTYGKPVTSPKAVEDGYPIITKFVEYRNERLENTTTVGSGDKTVELTRYIYENEQALNAEASKFFKDHIGIDEPEINIQLDALGLFENIFNETDSIEVYDTALVYLDEYPEGVDLRVVESTYDESLDKITKLVFANDFTDLSKVQKSINEGKVSSQYLSWLISQEQMNEKTREELVNYVYNYRGERSEFGRILPPPDEYKENDKFFLESDEGIDIYILKDGAWVFQVGQATKQMVQDALNKMDEQVETMKKEIIEVTNRAKVALEQSGAGQTLANEFEKIIAEGGYGSLKEAIGDVSEVKLETLSDRVKAMVYNPDGSLSINEQTAKFIKDSVIDEKYISNLVQTSELLQSEIKEIVPIPSDEQIKDIAKSVNLTKSDIEAMFADGFVSDEDIKRIAEQSGMTVEQVKGIVDSKLSEEMVQQYEEKIVQEYFLIDENLKTSVKDSLTGDGSNIHANYPLKKNMFSGTYHFEIKHSNKPETGLFMITGQDSTQEHHILGSVLSSANNNVTTGSFSISTGKMFLTSREITLSWQSTGSIFSFKIWKSNKVHIPISSGSGKISSRITQLNNNIDLALYGQTGATSRINVGEDIYIRGENIKLDGKVFMDNAFIKNLMVEKMTAETVTAYMGKFNQLISSSIDANYITTGRIDMVLEVLNGANSSVRITSSGMDVMANSTYVSTKFNKNGIEIWKSGTHIGSFESRDAVDGYDSPFRSMKSISMTPRRGSYLSWGYYPSSTKEEEGVTTRRLALDGDTGIIYSDGIWRGSYSISYPAFQFYTTTFSGTKVVGFANQAGTAGFFVDDSGGIYVLERNTWRRVPS
ncbi:phage tail spike protein [Ignavigranum ruoffiae]|uniref:phage tail spike protein n=1 Tax=Ignavigranum ruoffiae TaxID=89093 RepID=UPI0023543E40|nr:phage tail spike protein [Ignavigranum ruoffiae]